MGRRPQIIEEIRPFLLDFLNRVYFETKISIYLGVMDSPTLYTDMFGLISATFSRKIQSLDFEDICNMFAELIGSDLIRIESDRKNKSTPVTKYALYLHEVPSPTNQNLIRYAKQIH